MKAKLMLVCAGFLAAAVGVVGTSFRDHFQLPQDLQNLGGNIGDETTARLNIATAEAKQKNMALMTAIFGAGLCLLSSLAAGYAVRGRPLIGATAGIVFGGGLGAVAGVANLLVYNAMREGGSDSFITTAVAHATLWVLVGLAFAVSVRIASRRKLFGRLVTVSLLCGGTSGAIFPFVSAVLFPLANPELPLPEGTGALVTWFAIPSLLFTAGAGQILSHKVQVDEAAAAPSQPDENTLAVETP